MRAADALPVADTGSPPLLRRAPPPAARDRRAARSWPTRAGPAGSRHSVPAAPPDFRIRVLARWFSRLLRFSPFPERAFNYAERAFGDLQSRELVQSHPRDLCDVVPGASFAAGEAAEMVDEHVVILGCTFRIANDALENLEDAQRLDGEARLFEHFAAHGMI